jgi:hypothetical protein
VSSVSVIAFPAVPETPEDREPGAQTPPLLRLVPEHEHVWQLRSVEYDESLEVRRYECTQCADVLFR